ncbi:alpha/beta hydrolase [Chelatococcus composti]|jgi:phospholipase/carboxylesterase|uniref:Phospholipase/carboxylesterase n=1 Tax=Chelatococcus composti TaxID=1743235 RepID=A0A841KEI2_9HYPH|nr:dienelactone hydrolase family protein [Chelatococcus composti]MBB6169752.1 phospholipase/carboxylesterase [Chelatococcus composti]MBS7736277.1 dienelactone hydrolase family protein [Chelatococcus composti]PZN42546.1 MAG: phospholipase [Pseudomonadota bacterium]GGG50041.1 phospholipase [Chelatococcus composti]
MDQRLIDGPRLAARSGATRQLVVFLHGYGADGNDLIDIGRQWQRWLPDAAFVSPHAPEPCGMSPMGRQWFALTFRDPDERWRGVNHAAPALDAFLDAELARHGLTEDRLALVGFSQGTMMALHVGLRRRTAPAAIVGYSGMLVGPSGAPPETMREEIRARPPVLLVHGDADEVIPVEALFFSAQALSSLEVPAQWHLSHGIGHGIDGEGLRHGGLFLARAFGLPYPA